MTTLSQPERVRFGRLVVLAPLVLAGCATASDGTRSTIFDDFAMMITGCDDELSASERSLCEAGRKHASTRLTGAATGAAVGCLVGFGAGALASNNSGTAAATTAVGCAAGGFLGYAAGAYVDRVNSDTASAQADLRTRIAAADQDAARYRQAANDADSSVQAIRLDIARLNTEYQAGAISADDYENQIERAEVSADALRALMVESAGTIRFMERDIGQLTAAGQDTTQLERRHSQLVAENERLVADYQELVAAIDTIPPGVDRPDVA